jgi:predicted secreted hydrolase
MKLFLSFLLFLSLLGIGGSSACAAEDWALVTKPRVWNFPKDFGAHPEYRTEWWYFTGNLADHSGSRYGYQLTFFRQGIRQKPPNSGNSWDIRDIYLAHFAMTDVPRNKFNAVDRLSRGGPGLAGASPDGMDVWLLNWSARMKGSVIYLEARDSGMELNFQLVPQKPPILHGQNGYSQKGPVPGQASYYTSLTDPKTRGTLKLGSSETPIEVQGTSWFDQEFGSNELSQDQKGWDWFSLHLSDGRDLMIYFLRLKDGSVEPSSSGTLVAPDGASRHLSLSDLRVSVLDHWKSPRSKGEYPSHWRIQIPSAKIDLTVTPLIADQELDTKDSTGITYWEGAVVGKGGPGGREVSCEGYVELTGYAGILGGLF